VIEAEKPALRGVTDVRAAGELSDAIWSPRCVRRHVDRRLLTRCVHRRGAELSRPAVSLRYGWR
jgi:hypothetical protein